MNIDLSVSDIPSLKGVIVKYAQDYIHSKANH